MLAYESRGIRHAFQHYTSYQFGEHFRLLVGIAWLQCRRVLLKKALPFNTVGVARQYYRAVFEIRQHPRRNRLIVVKQISFIKALSGPENFAEIGRLEIAGFT